MLHGAARAKSAELQREFAARWGRILAVPEGAREVTVSTADIETAVRERFASGGDGWTTARYLSPDVLIAAESTEAIERGDFTLVLGELHMASNTLGASCSPTSTRTSPNSST